MRGRKGLSNGCTKSKCFRGLELKSKGWIDLAVNPSDDASLTLPDKQREYAKGACICGFWFLLTSWVWTYLANVFISLPVGILGMVLWSKARSYGPSSRLTRSALLFHIAGVILSVFALTLYK